MPEKIIEKIKKSIPMPYKTCFWAAIIVGLITHLYKITNWMPNWDGLVFRYDGQNMLSLGRWFLSIASAPSSFYDLPWVTGLLAILFHALGAMCICKMFDVRKNTTAAIIGAAVVSFPVVSSVMMYSYVADSYALSFLLACLSAWLMTKEKPRYLLATVLLTLAVGTYQAYLTVTIMLLLCHFILQTLRRGRKGKDLLIESAKCLLCGGVGMALYYGVLTVALKMSATEISSYQGFDSAVSLSGIDIPASLYVMKDSLVSYFFDFSNGISVFSILNIIILVLTTACYLWDLIKSKPPVSKILLFGLYVLLLPIGASILVFVNSSIDYHNLMKMGFFVFYLFFILQYEKHSFKSEKYNVIKFWSILVLAAAMIFNQIIIANVSYHKLGMAFEKSYGTLVRIADRIEQTEGADECRKILVVGALKDSERFSANLPPDMTGTTDGMILRADDESVGQSVLCAALNDYCGTDYQFVAGRDKQELIQKPQVANLSCWPAKDSICIIEDVVVIKLGE